VAASQAETCESHGFPHGVVIALSELAMLVTSGCPPWILTAGTGDGGVNGAAKPRGVHKGEMPIGMLDDNTSAAAGLTPITRRGVAGAESTDASPPFAAFSRAT
jgi:hypothetical protein